MDAILNFFIGFAVFGITISIAYPIFASLKLIIEEFK